MNYVKIYNQLIYKRQYIEPLTKIGDGTIETQHIIPKACMGPNEKWNLVNLTLREHYFAHELLVKIYAKTRFESAAIYAWNAMSMKINKKFRSSRLYMQLRLAYNKIAGNSNKGKRVINNGIRNKYIDKTSPLPEGWSYGMKPMSEEGLKNLRNSNASRRGKSRKCQPNQKTNKGKIVVNNGLVQKVVYPDAIPDGYVKGPIPFTEEHLNAIKIAHSKMSDKAKQARNKKISYALKHGKHTSWNRGKHLTDQHKQNIADANKGKKHSEQHKAKIKNNQLGKIKITNGIVTHYADKNNIPDGFKPGYIKKNGQIILTDDKK